MQRYDEILAYWFGHVEETIVPSKERARIWFSTEHEVDAEIRDLFKQDFEMAVNGQCFKWLEEPRGQLALILIYDQFARHFYRGQAQAFVYDQMAVSICLSGIEREHDHQLSLIERVYYYFPLLHAEDLALQQQSIFMYRSIVDLSLQETRGVFESFLEFAEHHYEVIRRFGRFPQRNEWLKRQSTAEELIYLTEYVQDQS